MEFALMAVPLSALILFSLQVAVIYFADQSLQTFNESISRTLLTGATQQAGLTQASFRSQVCSKLPSLFSCSNLYIDVESYTSFSAADVAALNLTGAGNVTTAFKYSPGGSGNIVAVRMVYLWPVVGTLIGQLSNQSNGAFGLTSVSVFKAEPYV